MPARVSTGDRDAVLDRYGGARLFRHWWTVAASLKRSDGPAWIPPGEGAFFVRRPCDTVFRQNALTTCFVSSCWLRWASDSLKEFTELHSVTSAKQSFQSYCSRDVQHCICRSNTTAQLAVSDTAVTTGWIKSRWNFSGKSTSYVHCHRVTCQISCRSVRGFVHEAQNLQIYQICGSWPREKATGCAGQDEG